MAKIELPPRLVSDVENGNMVLMLGAGASLGATVGGAVGAIVGGAVRTGVGGAVGGGVGATVAAARTMIVPCIDAP